MNVKVVSSKSRVLRTSKGTYRLFESIPAIVSFATNKEYSNLVKAGIISPAKIIGNNAPEILPDVIKPKENLDRITVIQNIEDLDKIVQDNVNEDVQDDTDNVNEDVKDKVDESVEEDKSDDAEENDANEEADEDTKEKIKEDVKQTRTVSRCPICGKRKKKDAPLCKSCLEAQTSNQ